ncbi:uncharacterized protein LOC143741497 [Siphateles boraxobius]|uniref:uncharacterized protein LOC143741497 n=1 Tax=Siphateles boraxobius TaxID=180520 RepID=UPI004062FAF4
MATPALTATSRQMATPALPATSGQMATPALTATSRQMATPALPATSGQMATPALTATSGHMATPAPTPRKPTLTMASPISCTSDSSAMSSTVTSAMTRRTPSSACSPRMYIQTVSPLSLPPSPVSTTTSSIPSVAASAEVSATTSSSGTSFAPLATAPSGSATATPFFVSSAAPSVVGRSTHPTADIETAPGPEPGWLPAKLIGTIPPQDQKWISSALWRNHQLRTDLKLW